MNFTLHSTDPAQLSTQALVLPIFEGDLDRAPSKKELWGQLASKAEALFELAKEEGFKAKADQLWISRADGELKAKRLVLLGLGSRAKFEPEVLRLQAGKLAKTAQKLRVSKIGVGLPVTRELWECVRATVEGILLGAYKFDRYRTTGKDDRPPGLDEVRLLLPEGQAKSDELEEAVEVARWVAEAANWTRDLVNEPAGVMTPKRLAAEAQSLAKGGALKVTVRGRKEIEKLQMGMFLAVSQGSAEEPQLIEVAYRPKSDKDAKKPGIALVGKAITFDSGGLSLKTNEGMLDMKCDMAGAAAVLGAMRVVAKLKPPFPVTGYMGACENMPSGTSYKLGDVLVSRRKKTVEVTNTDAEGRLVLGDILTYASEKKPSMIVDLATLTGACIIALGNYVVGAFGEDDPAVWSVLEAAKAAGEEIWRMPIVELQKDSLRSEVADMRNTGERPGGAINAALFLREFVIDTPWVHLDIAGPAMSSKERGYLAKGATGVGVRTLVELVRRRMVDQDKTHGG